MHLEFGCSVCIISTTIFPYIKNALIKSRCCYNNKTLSINSQKSMLTVQTKFFAFYGSFATVVIIHVKLEKFKIGRSPSLHLAKEGDFTRTHSATLILSINIQIWVKILKMMIYITSLLWLKTLHNIYMILYIYYCTWWILCWLSNAFSLQNSIQFTLLRRKW